MIHNTFITQPLLNLQTRTPLFEHSTANSPEQLHDSTTATLAFDATGADPGLHFLGHWVPDLVAALILPPDRGDEAAKVQLGVRVAVLRAAVAEEEGAKQ